MFLARKINAELHFCHVIATPLDWVHLPKEKEKLYPEELKRIGHAEAELDKLMTEAATMGVKSHKSISFNSDYSSLACTLHEPDQDLIIVGSHGATGFRRNVLGTNAQGIVRNAKVPVMVIHCNTRAVHFDRLLFASGLEPDTHRAFEEFLNFTNLLGNPKVYFLVVTTPYNFQPSSKVRAMANEFLIEHPAAHVELIFANHNSIEAGIEDAAKELDVDITALARPQEKGLSSLIFESVPESLVRSVRQPVMSFPA
jgi:nucleotide-binding universal stress UspA family protein